MNKKVLYYPYINVPDSEWFTRMLLYWDEVGVIMPEDFIFEPDKLNPFTHSLLKADLLTPVNPGGYLWNIDNYENAFIEHLESNNVDLSCRRKSFKEGRHVNIHMEKMHPLKNRFISMGLAKRAGDPWYKVEFETGNEYMFYLAGVLGKLDDLHFTPITDDLMYLQKFVSSSTSDFAVENKISPLMLELLEDLFPVPSRNLMPDDIKFLKDKHQEELYGLRIRVEKEVIGMADVSDDALRKRRIDLFKEESKHEVNKIIAHFKEEGYENNTLTKFAHAFLDLTKLKEVIGPAKAILGVFGSSDEKRIDKDFLYAAYAQHELLT